MKTSFANRIATLSLALAAAGLLGGCATSGNPRDPIEGFNRAIFDINDGIDKAFIKPVAQGYEFILPSPVRTGVSNFFGNIDDVFIAVNNLLQGKVPEAAGDVSRVFLNTTIGLLGIFDVATEAGIEKHDEDFGQTFGRWGVSDGAYLVLPIIGPSTVRDGFGQILDVKADPVARMSNVPSRNTLIATRGINERARILPTDKIVEEAALDRYAYIRDAYLQRRRSRIYDGDPPRESDNAADSADASSTRVLANTHFEPVAGSVNLFVEREPGIPVLPAPQVAHAMPEARDLMIARANPAASRR